MGLAGVNGRLEMESYVMVEARAEGGAEKGRKAEWARGLVGAVGCVA